MAHEVPGRTGAGFMPGPTAVVAAVRGRVARGKVALALVEPSGVGSSTSTHLRTSLRSNDRAYVDGASGEARRNGPERTDDGVAGGVTASPAP